MSAVIASRASSALDSNDGVARVGRYGDSGSLATISHGNSETRVRRCTDIPARVCVRRARLAVRALLDRSVLEANNSEEWSQSR